MRGYKQTFITIVCFFKRCLGKLNNVGIVMFQTLFNVKVVLITYPHYYAFLYLLLFSQFLHARTFICFMVSTCHYASGISFSKYIKKVKIFQWVLISTTSKSWWKCGGDSWSCWVTGEVRTVLARGGGQAC